MKNFYNEIDPIAAQTLRNLIARGLIAPGVVDERSIEDITPDELKQYTQCHFFAGIGVWSLALRRAGWPDDRPVWTGSCPCQPFSAAGKGNGFDDERHLWPAWHHLISQCKPDTFFGEQVASKDGLTWLDLVQSDVEAEGYAFGAFDLCAAGFGAPHIRQRLYFVADTLGTRLEGHGFGSEASAGQRAGSVRPVAASGQPGGLADAGRPAQADAGQWDEGAGHDQPRGGVGRLEPCEFCGYEFDVERLGRYGCPNCEGDGLDDRPGPVNGHWRVADWLLCRDAKWRPVESGTFPLAHGAPARVGRLRAYGNAIVAQVAEGFIRAYCEARGIRFDESL